MRDCYVKRCDGLGKYKTDDIKKIFNNIKRLAGDSPGNSKFSLIAENLDKVHRVVEEERKIYDKKIKDLEKELQLLRCQNKSLKHDNLELDKENKDLKNKLIELEGNCKEELKKIKLCNKNLKNDLEELQIIYSQTLKEIKELEKESLEKNNKILELSRNKTVSLIKDGKKKSISANYPAFELSKSLNEQKEPLNKLWKLKAQENDSDVINMVELMERKCSSVMEEMHKLKLENKCQSELITSLKRQMSQKDEELERLRKKLDDDSPPLSLNPDDGFCCQCQQMKCRIGKLELQLSETIEKQHEAMTRAVQLAERNRNLERELKDIDKMAMAMEEECQSKVKHTARNVTFLQQQIAEKDDEIKSLKGEIMDLKIRLDKEKMTVDKFSVEKKSFERNLEDALRENKCLHERINHYVLRERSLRMEITKLQEINKNLQRELNGIEGKLGDAISKFPNGKEKLKSKKKNPALGLPTSTGHAPSGTHFSSQKANAKGDSKWENQAHQLNSEESIEREIRQKEFHCYCCREIRGFGDSNCHHDHSHMGMNYHRNFNELEHEIDMLKQENQCLKRELALRPKNDDAFNYCSSGDSYKILVDRLERERDLALSDVSKLQTERDILRERIKLTTESQIGENSRMERIIMENDERIRRLESERRELISSQGSQRANLTALEEKCEDYKTQLINVQNDLCRMTAQYNQLKTLQEETDRSLTMLHGKLSHNETELNLTLNKLKELENVNRNLEEQIAVLKMEKSTMKANIVCIEREKDDYVLKLDDKTELCSKLQAELKNRDKYITELNEKITNAEKQFDLIMSEKTSRDHSIHGLEREVAHLREDLEKCDNQKEAFMRENRRLHDDLTSAVKDCQVARRQLDCEKKEVENLKRQLQQYVNEVKKAEELLFQKESERNEMLDHFRSLSIEATTLESNNHSLESAVETTKMELIAANERVMNLEHEVANKESLVHSYESQIVDLTSRVAELETRLKHECEVRYRVEEDLAALRDLCTTIDDQKEILRRKASDSDAEKIHLKNEVQRLNEEYEGLNDKLTRERTLSHTLEKTLSHCRQETLEHKINNKDLKSQVQQLQLKVDELTEKLAEEIQNVQKYQTACSDLSCQVNELRREVTNVRFEKARALESTRRYPCKGKPRFDEDDSIDSANSLPVSSRTYTCSPPTNDARRQRFGDWSPSRTDTNQCRADLSYRSVPPLIFLEDSDRTVSFEEEMVPINVDPAFEVNRYVVESTSELSSSPGDCCHEKKISCHGSKIAWNIQDGYRFRCEPGDYCCDREKSRDCGVRDGTGPLACCLRSTLMESEDKCSFESENAEDLNGESDVNLFRQNFREDFDQNTYSIDEGNGSSDLLT